MIKLIIFDLSGVCFSNEEPVYLELFTRRHGLDRDVFLERYYEFIRQAETGKLAGKVLWKKLLREFGVAADAEEIIREMIGMKTPEPEVLELARRLKEHYSVVYITNYNEDYWELIKKRFDFPRWFSWGVVSCEIGVRKPGRQCFEHILARSRVRPEEAMFIDDSPGNLLEPAALGIHAIRFISRTALRDELRRFGLI